MFEYNPGTGQIRAHGIVGDDFEDGFGVSDILTALDDIGGKDIVVDLHSPGGAVSEGVKIFTELSRYPGRVEMRVDALAGSIASVIMAAGDRIVASEPAFVMVHNAWSIAIGNAKEMRGVAEVLEIMDGQIADIYSARSGQSREFWLELMDDETYLPAARALETGIIDEVQAVEVKQRPAARVRPVATATAMAKRSPAMAKAEAIRIRVDSSRDRR